MATTAERLIGLVRSQGLIRPCDLAPRRISRVSLTRAVRRGQLDRVRRGLYGLPGGEVSVHGSLAEVARRVPKGADDDNQGTVRAYLVTTRPVVLTHTGHAATVIASLGAVMDGPGGRGYGGHTDLDDLNRVGMWVALSFERNRLRRSGLDNAEIFDPSGNDTQPEALVFDVSTPDKIARARGMSKRFEASILLLNKSFGVSLEWPGFDVLTLDPRAHGEIDRLRLIELKSSGVASRVQEMSWNEWKTAGSSSLRAQFYLYLVGNLRSDLEGAVPFVRTIRNPFEQLVADVRVDHTVSRKVQLAVHLFREAEHLNLSVCANSHQSFPEKGGSCQASCRPNTCV